MEREEEEALLNEDVYIHKKKLEWGNKQDVNVHLKKEDRCSQRREPQTDKLQEWGIEGRDKWRQII